MTTAWRMFWGLLACGLIWQAAMGKGIDGVRGKASTLTSTAALRARGPEGLAEALRKYDELVAMRDRLDRERNKLHTGALFGDEDTGAPNAEFDEKLEGAEKRLAELNKRLERMAAAIDEIGGQRTCTVSRLYWYTDLEEAKAAAAERGKPILSLRMLGKLTDEYSCANSRYFRTALYSNKSLSDFLRANFVLHWQSVRPVPRVTIDFGDGRKLERTVTGNSAHHVLASDGTPIDVLPGLYSPLAFRQWAGDVAGFYGTYQSAPTDTRAAMLRTYHKDKHEELLQRWDADIQRTGGQRAELARLKINTALESSRIAGQDVPATIEAPKAAAASKQAIGKWAVEAPVLRFAKLGGTWMERGMDDELWQAIADYHRLDVKLDDVSVAIMRSEAPPSREAALRAVAKTEVEDPILRMVDAFEKSMALDTVRNEYLLHRRVHERFAEGATETASVDQLNEWVYAELFLTPSSDPWLGLATRDVYTALERDGRTEVESLTVRRSNE